MKEGHVIYVHGFLGQVPTFNSSVYFSANVTQCSGFLNRVTDKSPVEDQFIKTRITVFIHKMKGLIKTK
jgi:hypothetical protein